MTVLGEKELGVFLADSVQQVARPFSRELVPLPIPFPENEDVESERLRGLSRAVCHEARGLARLGERWSA